MITDVRGDYVRGVGAVVEVRLRSRGRRGWRGRVRVDVAGSSAVVEAEVPLRSERTVRIKVKGKGEG